MRKIGTKQSATWTAASHPLTCRQRPARRSICFWHAFPTRLKWDKKILIVFFPLLNSSYKSTAYDIFCTGTAVAILSSQSLSRERGRGMLVHERSQLMSEVHYE
jgi:hypothetical protein